MSEPRIVQPLVVMQPPPDPLSSYDDMVADQFTEDTTVSTDLTYEQWCAQRRPLPYPGETAPDLNADVPEI